MTTMTASRPPQVGIGGQLPHHRRRGLVVRCQQGDGRPHHQGQSDHRHQRPDPARPDVPDASGRRAHRSPTGLAVTTPSDATTTRATRPGRTSPRRSARARGLIGSGAQDPPHRPDRQGQHREAERPPTTANRGPSDRPSRASVPAMFWLVLSVAVPIRSVLRTVSVQYSIESVQASTNPASGRHHCGRGGPQQSVDVAAQQEIQKEHRGGEFEGDRQAQQHTAWPRRAARHAVGDHQRHQHHVDLAELEVRPDRLQPDDRRHHQARLPASSDAARRAPR